MGTKFRLRRSALSLSLSLLAFGCASGPGAAKDPSAIFGSSRGALSVTPDSIVVYGRRGALIRCEDRLPGGTERRLRIDDGGSISELTLEGRAPSWYAVETGVDPKTTRPFLNLRLPPNPKQETLELAYWQPQIIWYPRLQLRMQGGSRIDLGLEALIESGGSRSYPPCPLSLADSPSGGRTAAGPAARNLGVLGIGARQSLHVPLLSRVLECETQAHWYVNAGAEVQRLLRFAAPADLELGNLAYSLYDSGLLIGEGGLGPETGPGSTVELPMGRETRLVTRRSSLLSEDPGNAALPFRHVLSYEITNRSEERLRVLLVADRAIGAKHKTVYRFCLPPTRQAGDRLEWLLDVEKGSTQRIDFEYDSDRKNEPWESGYEVYEGGK